MPPSRATDRSAGQPPQTSKGKSGTAYIVGKWSAQQLDVLKSYVEAFKMSGKLHGQAKKEERKKVLTNALKDLKPLHPKLTKENWELVKLHVKNWFNFHARSREPKAPYVGKMKWTMQRVAGHLHKSEITDVAVDTSGEKPGEKSRFLGCYQPAVKRFVEGLDPEEKQEYQQLAEEWNKQGLPDDLRRKHADKGGRKWVQEMAEHGWKTYGMRMIIFEAHFNKQAEAVYATHDFNDRVGKQAISSFSVDNEDALETFEKEWAGYAYSALLHDAGRTEAEGAAAAGVPRRLPAAIIELDRDPYGLPIIPPARSMKGGDLDVLIRSFLTIHYRLVSQKSHVRPPWLNISDRQEEFVSADYVPEHFTIREPSRLKVCEKIMLLDFWRARQDNPKTKHAFLWTAHLASGEMIQHNYVIGNFESSSGPADKRANKMAKKPKTKKRQKSSIRQGKSKVVSTAADRESSNDSELEPPRKVARQRKKTSNEGRIEVSADSDSAGDDEDRRVHVAADSVHQAEHNRKVSKKQLTKSTIVSADMDVSESHGDAEIFGGVSGISGLESVYRRPVAKKGTKSTAIPVADDIEESGDDEGEAGNSDDEIESDVSDALPIIPFPPATHATTPVASLILQDPGEMPTILLAPKSSSSSVNTLKGTEKPKPAYLSKVSAQNERITTTNHGAPAKMLSGPFDNIVDLTGVRRTRTPSKKRKQMEAWDEPEPVKIKKQKVKKTDTLPAGESSTQKKQKIAECAVRPKPKPKVKKAQNNAAYTKVE